MRLRIAAMLLLLLVALGPAAAQPDPLGAQFQVNTSTTYNQAFPRVAAAGRNFVVVWSSEDSSGDDSDSMSIQGQRYTAGGTTVGGEFQVNSYTTGNQTRPAVAVAADGRFVVVWHSNGSAGDDTSGASVQAQRYDSDGTPVGGELQVNTYTTNWQMNAAVAMDADGSFVVVWQSAGSLYDDADNMSIQGQRFYSNGIAFGGEFQINSYTTGMQFVPAVAMDGDGAFVVVWESEGSSGDDTSSYSVQGQRYGSDWLPAGGEFQVNTYTTNYQDDPAVAMAAGGEFVVVWTLYDASGYGNPDILIRGQRYASDGTPLDSEFQVSSYTTDRQYHPAVTTGVNDFVVVWQSNTTPSLPEVISIQAQHFASDGTRLGAQFQVNTYSTEAMAVAEISGDNGDFVVVWQSFGSPGNDDSLTSVQGRRYSTTLIFADGFESGNLNGWSSSVP